MSETETWRTAVRPCPRCGRGEYATYDADREDILAAVRNGVAPPALSRADNTTYICSPCGTDEALRQWSGEGVSPVDEWPIERSPSTDDLLAATDEAVSILRRKDES